MAAEQAVAERDEGAATKLRRFMGEVAPSAGRASASPRFGPPALTDLFAYWNDLPRRDGMPDAADFDPLTLMQWLPDMTMASLNSPDEMIFRLVGTRVAERMTHDPTGTNMLDLLSAETRRQVARDMHEIGMRPCGYHARYMNVYGSGRVSHVQSIYLPLRAPVGQPCRLIAVHAPEEALEYQRPADLTICATSIDEIVWIDVGYGTPETA